MYVYHIVWLNGQSRWHENKISIQSKTSNNVTIKSSVNWASAIQQPPVLLWMAKVRVKDSKGKLQEFRVLLDNGSQSNFISQYCILTLGLTTTKVSGVSVLYLAAKQS
jgi:hypothetical protein